MQPTDKNRTKIQTGISRARLLLKRDLGWLPGYPLSFEEGQIRWQALPWETPGEPFLAELDRESVRRAQMTLSKLRHRFPRALPKVVSDVDEWLLRMDHLLDLIKGWLHDKVAPNGQSVWDCPAFSARERSDYETLRDLNPPLANLYTATSYLELGRRETAPSNPFVWIAAQADCLQRIAEGVPNAEDATRTQLTLVAFRDELPDTLISPLARCLCEPLLQTCPRAADEHASQLRATVSRAVKGKEWKLPEEANANTLGQLLRQLLDHAWKSTPKRRRLLFSLLDTVVNDQRLDQIESFRTEIQTEEKRLLKQLRRASQGEPLDRRGRQKLQSALETDFDVSADAQVIKRLFELLAAMPGLTEKKLSLWNEFLRCLPEENQDCRAGLYSQWESLFGVDPVIAMLTKVFRRRGACPSLVKDWQTRCRTPSRYSYDFVRNVCACYPGETAVHRRAVELLEQVAYDGEETLNESLLCTIAAFAKVEADHDRSSGVLRALMQQEVEDEYSEDELLAALAFGEDDQAVVELLRAFDKSEHAPWEWLRPLIPLAADDSSRSLLTKMVLDDDERKLSRLASMAQLVTSLGGRPVPPPAFVPTTGWMDRYPVSLHGELVRLDEVTGNGEAIAETVLQKNFPSEQKTRREIESLEKLIDQSVVPRPELQQRLDNLRSRLRRIPEVSPDRLRKLTEKLRARVELERYNRCFDGLRGQAQELSRQRYGLSEIPQELLSHPLDSVLSAVMQLDGKMRSLGTRLLFQTFRSSTRGFDDEPANAAFRQTMQQRGIVMEPWLSDHFQTEHTTKDGLTYRLSFTRDVVDFLLMGFHFGTCLSPNSFNFFSTVANAVDLNKRVVYAKTDDGQPLGRCLFAINDDGGILTFYRYCHEDKYEFDQAVEDFAKQLAADMKTHLASRGDVRSLVADQWYNDGPINLSTDLHAFDGEVRSRLRQSKPESLLHDFDELLAPGELRARLREILEIVEIREHPDRLAVLVQRFAGERLSAIERLHLAVAAHRSELSETAHELLGRNTVRSLSSQLRSMHCDACSCFHGLADYHEIFAMLLACHPSLAIRVIRGSRARSIKHDTDDTNASRRFALAQAHRELGRERLAAQLLGKSPA